jgi:hypothetical protein
MSASTIGRAAALRPTWVDSRHSPSSISVRTVLFLAAVHNPKRIVRKRPLKRKRLVDRHRQPSFNLFRLRQNHRHGLRMDRRDNGVWLRRKEGEEIDFGLGPL